MADRTLLAGVALASALTAAPALAQAPFRKMGELELSLKGVSAAVEPARLVVPKNVASGARVRVRARADELSPGDLSRFLGDGFEVQAELSGPGLAGVVSLPRREPGEAPPADPLLLALPPLPLAGEYALTHVRIVAGGRVMLDVAPARVPVQVVEQILVTSVTTRALTLDEIREKGIVLDSDDYLGYEFTLGLTLESTPVNISFPVVFDREGVAVPQPLAPPPEPARGAIALPPLPAIVPLLLEAENSEGERVPLSLPGGGGPVRIPGLLVIPGNVGYLKQFFSAQLFVANGAPVGSGLLVRDITATVKLPAGADHEPGTADDPLALPELLRDGLTIVQPTTMDVRGLGPDGQPGTADDVAGLDPAEQAQAEFLIRGEQEGFHTLDFDLRAVLDGLAVGPVVVKGKASGGVLVRNPFFDVSFTVPSVVRRHERFKLFLTVSNIGQGVANDVSVGLDAARMSGARLLGDATQRIDTLESGDAHTLEFLFESERTGQVVASYLRFEGDGATGRVNFTLGVGERGVPLSPDTLVLPAAVDALPETVVNAAMRVLGQAWSVASAPSGTLPSGVLRASRAAVTQKALALAEAGLRTTLGQPLQDAVRDVAFDFWGPPPLDPGFDQLLRRTEAGRDLALALGAALEASSASDAVSFERFVAEVAASGPDVVTFAAGGARLELTLSDAAGGTTATPSVASAPSADVVGAALLPLGTTASAPVFGLVTAPSGSRYVINLRAPEGGTVDLSVTLPRGDGTLSRGYLHGLPLSAGERARVVADLSRPDELSVEADSDGDGVYESRRDMVRQVLSPGGPRLLSGNVIGPETLDGASPFGLQMALLFDRVVNGATAAVTDNYVIPANRVHAARSQLSGRLVFAALERPEGAYVPTTVTVSGIADSRGAVAAPVALPLGSRIEDAGAIVSGRVLAGDGTPVSSGLVTYLNQVGTSCLEYAMSPLAAVSLEGDGRFELRYVRQDNCGLPFELVTQDPATGARRSVTRFVRGPGEQIVLDIVLLGRGTVAGVVRDLAGRPVGGARVVAVSATDPQVGGDAFSDGDGRYRIAGITVGGVNVRAGKGASLGRSSGHIDRGGGTAAIDITLDGGSVRVSGTVRRLESGVVTPVPGLTVLYFLEGVPSPIGAVQSDLEGRYAFEGMPTGAFGVEATLDTRDRGSLAGVAVAGDDLRDRDIVILIPAPETLGMVRGVVRMPDLRPAGGVVVSVGARGVLSDAEGRFAIPGIDVLPNQTVAARTRDGLRSGSSSFSLFTPGQEVETAITLSGLAAAEFTVVDAQGRSLPDVMVRLTGLCADPCGCRPRSTNALGRVRFEDLPLGSAAASAIRSQPGFTDVASTAVSLTRDGGTGFGVLRFAGAGAVAGRVLDPAASPVTGAEVTLNSRVFFNDGMATCGLVPGTSHRSRTDADGRFRFGGVGVGPVSLMATNPPLTAAGRQGTLSVDGEEVDFTLQLVDTMAGKLSGTVFLPDGSTPAGPGVEVTAAGALPDVVVRTNDQGGYAFARIFPQGSYTLTVRDPSTGGVAEERIFLRPGEDANHDLRLLGRGTVRVRVVDGAGEPVESAFVRLRETDFPARAYEAAVEAANEGVATFANVFEGRLSVEAADAFGRGGRTSSVLPGAGDTVEVKVRLTVTGTVRGRFLRPDGTTPIPFGMVRLLAGGRVVGQATTQGTGNAGAFSFDYVPAGAIRLEAQDPLTARTGLAVGTLEAEGQELMLDVVAQALGTVVGRVTSNGEDAIGAHVDVVSGSFKVCTFADSAGRYRMEGVPEGRVVVTASWSNGFLSGTAAATLSGERATLELDVPLRRSGEVTGRVESAEGGPAPTSLVTILVGGAGGGSLSTTTDIAGRFRFERVPAGPATLNVDVLGSIDQGTGTAEVPAAGSVDVAVTLNGVGILEGRTLDSAGSALAGDLLLRGSGPFPYTFFLRVGNDGLWRLPEVLAGPVTASLTARAGDFTLYGTAAGEVRAGEAAVLDVQVQPSGRVTGVVLRAGGASPAFGAEVTLELDRSRGRVTLQAQADGRFHALGVPLGAFLVRARDPLTAGVGVVEGHSLEANAQDLDVGALVLDDSPPAVVAMEPPDGAVGVAPGQPVRVRFSDRLLNASGTTITANGSWLNATPTLSPDGLTVTLNYAPGWPDSSDLVVTVSTAVLDVHGRHPAQSFTSGFQTADLSAPAVVAISPANQAIQVEAGAVVRVVFNEPLSGATNLAELLTLSRGTADVAGSTVLALPTEAVFTPAVPLALDTAYTVTVKGAVDGSANQQVQAFTSSFKTRDTLSPTLTLTSPSGPWTRSVRPFVAVVLSDPSSGIDGLSAALDLDGVRVVQGTAGSVIAFTPTSDLAEGPHAVAATVADRAGNRGTLAATFGVDSVPPEPGVVTGLVEGQVLRGPATVAATAVDVTSGVASIELWRDGAWFLTLGPPSFQATYSTAGLTEGAHALTARATDVAGNMGVAGPPVNVVVDNLVLTVAITAPVTGTRVRESVLVKASLSEPAERVEFRVGALAVIDTAAPYEATLDVGGEPEGPLQITVTAVPLAGAPMSATQTVTVDRTPPSAPDAARITAEEATGEQALVLGLPSAVEALATVEATPAMSGVVATRLAAADGSFALGVAARVGDPLSLVAIDAAGNRSAATVVAVERKRTDQGVPLTGLQLWVKADEGVVKGDADGVSQWTNQVAGGTIHLTQDTAGARPLWVDDALNHLPVLRFDGTDDLLRFTTRLTTIRTVFWVIRQDPAAAAQARVLLGDLAGTTHFYGGTSALWSSAASPAVRDGQTWLNGVPVDGLTTPRPTTFSVLSVVTTGEVAADNFARYLSQGATSWQGELAELLVYDAELSGPDRKAVEDHLAVKYALYVPAVAMPTISPNGGRFSGSTTIRLATTTPDAVIHFTTEGSEPSAASPVYAEPFAVTETTTVKARAFRAGVGESDTAVATFVSTGEFSPATLGGLALWLRADAGITLDAARRVSAWADQSGNGNDAVQPSTALVPARVALPAGLPALRFDGIDDFLKFKTRLTTIRTVFWVIRQEAATPAGPRLLLGDTLATTDFWGGTSTLWHPSSTSASIRSGATWLDGAPVDGLTTERPSAVSVLSVVTTANTTADNFARYLNQNAYNWSGDLAELIVYDVPLSNQDRRAVEDYLAAKYRLPGAAVATPSISPAGGRFAGSLSVTLSTTTPGAAIVYTTDGSEPSPSSPSYDGPLTIAATTTVKARALRDDLLDSGTATATFVSGDEFSPATVAGLRLWLRADAGIATSGGEWVGRWEDQSGQANHAAQPNGAAIPRLMPGALNGLPVVHFDGRDDSVTFSARMTGIQTVFWVVRQDAATATGTRLLLGDTLGTIDFWGGTSQLWHPNASAFIRNGATWINGVPVDGVSTARPTSFSIVSLVTTAGVTADNFAQYLGQTATNWSGDLAELIVYDVALSGQDRRAVEDYLALKYRPYAVAAATPSVSPAGGRFTGAVAVALSTVTPGAAVHYTTDGTEPTASSPLYGEPFLVTATTTVKARAFRADLAASATATAGFLSSDEFSPASLGGLRLWLRADAGIPTSAGDRVVRWEDQSGHGNHAAQTAGVSVPRLVPGALAGLPVLRFDGAGDYLKLTTRLTSIRTVFWVLRQDPGVPPGQRVLLGDTLGTFDFSTGATTIWSSGSTSVAIRSGSTVLNGLPVDGTLTPRPTVSALLSLVTSAGTTADNFARYLTLSTYDWPGDLAELIIFDTALSVDDRRRVEDYLNRRYHLFIR